MTLSEVLVILQNRIISLQEAKKTAIATGELQKVIDLDNDLITTSTTIEVITKSINNS